jgi:hypothetical protein
MRRGLRELFQELPGDTGQDSECRNRDEIPRWFSELPSIVLPRAAGSALSVRADWTTFRLRQKALEGGQSFGADVMFDSLGIGPRCRGGNAEGLKKSDHRPVSTPRLGRQLPSRLGQKDGAVRK